MTTTGSTGPGGGGPGGPGGPGGGSAAVPDDTITATTSGVSFISLPYNSTSSTTLYNPNDAYAALSGTTAISGATAATYAIAATASSDNGLYYCVVTNGSGSTVSFSVAATGSGTLSYQWYKGGVAISGATNSTFTITSVASTDAGSYTVVVANPVGSVTSTAATLTIASAIPVVNVTAGSVDETTEGGGKAFFVFTRMGADDTSALTVYYKAKGTATNGTRFTGPGGVALSGVAVIPAGATKLKIKAVNDSVYEGAEKVKLVLKTPADVSYTPGTSARAVLLVLDND